MCTKYRSTVITGGMGQGCDSESQQNHRDSNVGGALVGDVAGTTEKQAKKTKRQETGTARG